jgi:hypothetical protein
LRTAWDARLSSVAIAAALSPAAPLIVIARLLQVSTEASERSFSLRLHPETRHELKGLRLSGHEKSAIVKADRDPTIFAALDYFADLTLQRYLGCFSDQPDSIANLESALDHGTSYRFAFSPSSTSRRSVSVADEDMPKCHDLV